MQKVSLLEMFWPPQFGSVFRVAKQGNTVHVTLFVFTCAVHHHGHHCYFYDKLTSPVNVGGGEVQGSPE